jgi:hypothetical protein
MRETYGTLLHPEDLVTDQVIVRGTAYLRDQIVVTSVESDDLITVGVILDIVIRLDRLLFIVALHRAVRTPSRFFQAYPCGEVKTIDQKHLSDFKPLYKRDKVVNFRFLLHHHLPTPIS